MLIEVWIKYKQTNLVICDGECDNLENKLIYYYLIIVITMSSLTL